MSIYLLLNIINRQAYGLLYTKTYNSLYGGNEYGKSGPFSLFEALNNAFSLKCNCFQGFIFTPYQRHREQVGP